MTKGRRKFSTAELISALRKHAGIQTDAARELGVHRSAVHKRVQRDPTVRAELREIETENIDEAEGVIRAAILAGDLATSRWFLDRRGGHLGYGSRPTLRLSSNDIAAIVATLAEGSPEVLPQFAREPG